ncbi:sensor domain-containing diguanylate cyclase [Neobacillus drentensis]|uniref:sensor domain-containing diguanylate cyclase n=1 Tax=Neobacillus drentensis TaxID=220684 RepID=UPI002FFE6D74
MVVLYTSPSYLTVLGYSSDTFEGKCALDWIHQDDIKSIVHQLNSILEGKECSKIEYRFRNVNGDWVWFEAKVTPVFKEDGVFKNFLLESREITERRSYEETLTHMAFHDMLTGLPNQRLFKDRLDKAIMEAARYNRKMAVMYMDMDGFKQINDTFGHDVGDELLKQFAKRVKGCIRDYDTIARQGGDEFTVLLPEILYEQDALEIAQRIINSLQELWKIGEHAISISSSIGIAFFPKDGIERQELLKYADRALYRAKEEGKNKYQTYSSLEVSIKNYR